MRRALISLLSCSIALLAVSATAQERGLTAAADALGGPHWQSRFVRDTPMSALPVGSAQALWLPVAHPQTLRLLGDYQFSALRLGDTGGLRLTGGLLVNLRPGSTWGVLAPDSAALPYAGIGYASGGLRGDWGFSADIGLAAQGLGALRLDRLFNGASGLSVDGSPRLLPMVRLGVNLAF